MRAQSTHQPDPAHADEAQPSLGSLIRRHRLRRSQLHNHQAWTQEDLAVAIGSDKSHVNRIERGHQQPTKQTLIRICDALELSWGERGLLLGLAGFLVEPPAPTPPEIRAVVEQLRATVLAADYSMSLQDTEVRVWELNDIVAYAFLGYSGRVEALPQVYGVRNMELMLDHPVGEWWRRVIVDFDGYARRHLAQFRRNYRYRQHLPEYQRIMDLILQDRHIHQLWDELVSADASGPRFLDHQRVKLDHPEVGRLAVQIWHSSLISDDRFLLTHLFPADPQTRATFAKLKRRFDRGGEQPELLADYTVEHGPRYPSALHQRVTRSQPDHPR
jgi:transcriptional regulator with XRE-family HTH domain